MIALAATIILASLLGDTHLRWPGRPRVALVGALPLVSPAMGRDRADLARAHDPDLERRDRQALPPRDGRGRRRVLT